MKITFVQPRYFNIWEALGPAYIAAYLRSRHRGPLTLKFFQGYFDSDETIVQDAATSDIVAFSCTSPVFARAVRLARAVKEIRPEVRTVFGGFHPSAVPEDCLEQEGVDQVVVGEGEEAFFRIVSGENASIVRGERLLSLDEITPDRELIQNQRTIDLCEKIAGMRITSFQSARVCPFRCAFCSERIVTGVFNRKTNPIRERDARHLLDEIDWTARKYRLDYFKFSDATWNTSVESNRKVTAFCEEKIRRNLRLPWEANVHAAFVTKEMLKIMKTAGCRMINVGCESGSQKILNDMHKSVTVEKIREVFRWAREIGLERRAFFLIGMPNETREDVLLTEKLIEELDPEVFGLTILCPYPGSDLYDPQKMRGYDWSLTDEYANPYWETEHFTNAELKNLQRRLTEKFRTKLAWHHTVMREGGEVR
jgi:radical SAM superfamily enzyme YgiQ (UPF0313 family)